MKALKGMICMLLCVVMTVSLPGCKHKAPDPHDEIIYYRVSFEPETLDPQIAEDSVSKMIVMNIFEGLVRINEQEEVVPGAAQSWEVSEGGTVYTFHLRRDAHWNNGEEVTAEDFLYGLQRTIQPQTGSNGAVSLYCIRNARKINQGEEPLSKLGVTVTDPYTLRIELEDHYPDFLSLLATAPAMPCNRSFFEQTRGQYGRDADKLLSNGAFYIRSAGWEHDKYINLRRNYDYSGAQEPVPAGVNIEIAPAPLNVCQTILDGQLDCYALPAGELPEAQKNHLNLTSFGDTVWGIAFNTENEILNHPEIRLALLRALDRSYLLKQLPQGCTETAEIIPDGASYHGSSYREAAGPVMNVQYSGQASEELRKAMKKLDIESLPKLSILCTDDEATQKIVNNLIETWNALTGSYINKTPVSRSELNDRILSGEYRVVIAPLTSNGESPVNTLELFCSGSKYNVAQLSDKTYDHLVDDCRISYASLESVVRAEQYLAGNGIFYPLYLESRYYASAPHVTGIIFHPYGAETDFFFAKKLIET